jgi:hypothetical protein
MYETEDDKLPVVVGGTNTRVNWGLDNPKFSGRGTDTLSFLDLRIDHDRVGSRTDPNLNRHLKYPNNLDQSLNDKTTDKLRKYRADYNNRSPSVVSFMTTITGTSGRLHSEFYSYRLIGKLTSFFHLQEFCQRNQIVDSSTITTKFSLSSSKGKLVCLLLRWQFYVLHFI